MSRWDALDPSRKTGLQCRLSTESNWNEGETIQNKHVRPANSNKSQHGRSEASVSVERFLILTGECRKTTSTHSIARLATFVSKNLSLLPVDKVSHDAVEDIFLPFLQADCNCRSIRAQTAVLETLEQILDHKAYWAEMMAPLVEDITDTGGEAFLTNPIRCHLFEIIQKDLLRFVESDCDVASRQSIDRVEAFCRCLLKALMIAKVVEGTKKHAGRTTLDLDPTLIQKLMLTCWCEGVQSEYVFTNLKQLSLRLLQALLLRHPEACPALFVVLLCESTSSQHLPSFVESCSVCWLVSPAFLLRVSHDKFDYPIGATALNCISDLLVFTPFNLWLSQGHNPPSQQSAFRRRLMSGLENTIRSAICHIRRKKGTKELYRLCSTVLTSISFDLSDKQLLVLGCDLVSELARNILDPKLPRNHRILYTGCLEDNIGGKVCPDGRITSTSIPFSRFLDSEEGKIFLQRLIKINPERDPYENKGLHLLGKIAKNIPRVFFNCPTTWHIFVGFIATSTRKCKETKSETLVVLKSLLEGRKTYGICEGAAFSASLIPLILPLLNEDKGNKERSCSIYGSFLTPDWELIEKLEDGCGSRVRCLLSVCVDMDAIGKVRSEACKTVGDMCPALLARDSPEATGLCSSIVSHMSLALKDHHAAVRGMALYALGNLAIAIKDWSKYSPVLSLCTCDISELVSQGINDFDDKVAGNAIRALGHIASLRFKIERCGGTIREECSSVIFFDRVMTELGTRLDAALPTHQLKLPGLTWKQRSAIKKHAWGAAHSLSTIFKIGIGSLDEYRSGCAGAVASLLRCMCCAVDVHEKIALSAGMALRTLDSLSLRLLTRQSLWLSAATGACTVLLSKIGATPFLSTGLVKEIELLLLHFLRSCTLSDASSIVTSVSRSKRYLNFLYEWMVSKNLPSEVFNTFLMAMSKHGVDIDVRVERSFACRAVNPCMHEQIDTEDEI